MRPITQDMKTEEVIMSKEILEFDYTDVKGKQSHRIVWPIAGPSDKYFAVDLTEFEQEEREFLTQALNDIYTVYLAEIKALGLGSNYRYFKEQNVEFTRKANKVA